MSATYQRTVVFENLNLTKVNRANHYNLYASGKAVNSARVLAQLEKDCVITVCPLPQNNSKEFTISFDRQALADYLGVERSAMSAELSKLRNEGILESEKNKFKLL